MEDSRQELHFESFTSVTESYYTYNSPNQSAGPSPTFSRKAGENDNDLTGNNLSIISRGSLGNSRFSLERTIQSEAFEEATKIESRDSNDGAGGIPWKSILFGFLLIAAIVCVTSLIIIVPRNNQEEEEEPFNLTPTCSSFGSNVADGFCDDHLNSRTCDFDGGDCCLQTAKSKDRCTECRCALDEEEVSTAEAPSGQITTISPTQIKKYGEICDVEGDEGTCYLTGAIQYGAKSSKTLLLFYLT